MRVSFFPPCIVFSACIALAQLPGTFTATGSMSEVRSQHTATLLLDGRVLLAGGYGARGEGLTSAEVYDPSTGAFTATGRMATPRRMHSSTLLPDGRILIAGGYSLGTALPAVELYDPASGTFSTTGSLIFPRGGHTAILLANGKVLILGGYGSSGFPLVAPAEIYDPASGSFTPTGSYRGSGGCDFCAPSTLLADGRILFPQQSPAQLYDPVTGTFRLTGSWKDDQGSAALLMDGRVLFAGGEDDFGRKSDAELYDPVTGAFSFTSEMAWRRVWHTLTLLPDGTVLAAGGETDGCAGNGCTFAGSVVSAELYSPSTGTFAPTGAMIAPRETHTATLLNDGRVLIAGGESYGGIGVFFGGTATAELYTPAVLVPAPQLFSLSANGKGQGAIWHATTGDVASPSSPAVAGEVLSMYTRNLIEGGVIPPQVAIGGRLAEVLYFGDAPGYPGYYQVNFRVPEGVAAGLDVSVRLTYLSRPSNEVTVGVR